MKILPSLAALGLPALLVAQNASVSVLHGVPGLPAPVEVFANGGRLFAFDYGQQRGPLSLPPGAYALDVRLNGASILSTNANVTAGADIAVIAHLDANGTPRLSSFGNSLQALTLPKSRLSVRHTAQAPAVDVILRQNGAIVAVIPNLANGSESVADVAPGDYTAQLNVAGTSTVAFGPIDVVLEDGYGYGLFAVGTALTPTFRLLTQRVDLAARVTVAHGIPGLPAPVTVRANGGNLFSFAFGDVRGPLVVGPGSYTFDVVLNGTPVLARNATLARGDDVTIAAHLDATGGLLLSSFANDTAPIPNGHARLTVRHLAQAPAVDAVVDNGPTNLAVVPGLANGQQAVTDVPRGNFTVSLFAAGTTTRAFGPAGFRPQEHVAYQFLAVGSIAGGTFRVLVLQQDLAPAVAASIGTRVGGSGCGPQIAASPASFDFGQPWLLQVTGAPASGMALVNFGDSITAAGSLTLPFSLQPFGSAAGCALHTNVLATLMASTDAQGRLDVEYLVPRALSGTLPPVYFQVGVLGTSGAFPWLTSQYLELR
jgi:hypothetical protein